MALPVVQYPNVNPDDDAKALHDAFKGIGTDEKVLVKVICNRSRQQLQIVEKAYEAKYHKNLKKDLKSETSGWFRKLLVYRFKTPYELKKRALFKAVKGAGTNERLLIDALAFTPNAEMAALAREKDLTHKVINDLSGHFKDAIKDLFGADRSENPQVNPAEIANDVDFLYKSGEKKIGTDEKAFIKILTNKAPWYNQALNQAYKAKHGHTLGVAIDREFSGALKELLNALLQAPYDYWAERLYKDMEGVGTNDKELTFIFGYLEKNELKLVEQLFNARYPKGLKNMLKGDLTGHYEKAVLELLGY
jgi:annexin A7/11